MSGLQRKIFLKIACLRKIAAFIKKDFLIQLSYPFSFIFSLFSILVTVATFYFISKLFGQEVTLHLKDYQTGYFPFVLIGIAFSGYLSTAIHSFSQNIRHEQIIGTLEAMMVTPTKLSILIISMSLWDFLFTSITTVVYLLFGVLFFKVDLSQMNLLAALIILILTIVSFSSIGIISASFIMVFKKGDPISWLITTFSGFFGGVFFPISILPKPLQTISYLFPITYSLRALRQALLQGYSLKMLASDIGVLLVFCVVLLPLSIWIFKCAIKKAKQVGSLAHY
ncbi:MAG: ABC transporter permease [Candidatus Omnitrophica bacterium CG02_land_8_20_14_3_00__42_8]|nr:MAG: ABC transporter permease [Candidatus Omnitrophica bacterium CG02_land_8_20_14_3_00__42_8]PIW67153.1 MAG: ABC transporter permease [Candidatus Omnitrophica bacterium CG12_big_fil_rev_8_21_14_0_65_42_8]